MDSFLQPQQVQPDLDPRTWKFRSLILGMTSWYSGPSLDGLPCIHNIYHAPGGFGSESYLRSSPINQDIGTMMMCQY
jgi:hypothetical protein